MVVTKKELLEAQSFSRRRLLTAFTAGAPGGQEAEPAKPWRAVIGGVALTALLIGGSFAFGMLSPTLPEGWDNHALVVTQGVGTRYVALEGTLYPVLNTTSARLLIPADSFHVVDVSPQDIETVPRGRTLGIPGAPDALPTADALINTDWLSCTAPDGTVATRLARSYDKSIFPAGDSASAPQGLLVTAGDELHLVVSGTRYLVPAQHAAAVLRAIGFDTVEPWAVAGTWLNLFTPGPDLTPLALPDGGAPLSPDVNAPSEAVVGSVLTVDDGSGEANRYVINATGDLALLSDFAYPLYRLGSDQLIGPDIHVTSAQIARLRTAIDPAAPAQWPSAAPGPVSQSVAVCAHLTTAPGASPQVGLIAVHNEAGAVIEAGAFVEPAGGALVRAGSAGYLGGDAHVIDQTGTAFAIPNADGETLARLGFRSENIAAVPQSWLDLFPSGPVLSPAAVAGAPAVTDDVVAGDGGSDGGSDGNGNGNGDDADATDGSGA